MEHGKWLNGKCLVAMLAAAMLWPTSGTRAEKYNREASHYSVTMEGTNKLRFKIPTYEKKDYDCWDEEVYVYITPAGGTKETVLYLESEKDISGSNYCPNVTGYKGVEGTMIHYRDRSYSNYTITGVNQSQKWGVPCVDGQSYTCMNILWTVPDKYRGKDITISWTVKTDGNLLSRVTIDVSSMTFRLPEPEQRYVPMVMDPTLAYDAAHAGQTMVMYMVSASNVQGIRAYYNDVNGDAVTGKTIDLGTTTSGYIYLPTDHRISNFRVESVYQDSEKRTVTTQSEPQDIPLLHTALGLTAQAQRDGTVRLMWSVPWTKWADIAANDLWEIQRNTSGTGSATDAGWHSIGQVTYEQGEKFFTYDDETLMQEYEGKAVYYRVRRMNTATWNWQEGSGYALACLPATLALPAVTTLTAQRATKWTDTSHPVALDFAIGGPTTDSQGRMILRTEADWEAFAKAVNEGQTSLGAIMAADIELTGKTLTMVASDVTNAYNGTFDGNGHALIFHTTDTAREDYYAPFRHVGMGTIRNLHTKGELTSTKKFTSGLVAHRVQGAYAFTVENCRVSVSIDGALEGDATNGGLIAHAVGPVEIRNSLFDGRFIGDKSYGNGGFVGYSSNDNLRVSNSLFAPAELSTDITNCRTFARNASEKYITVESSYYTTSYAAFSSAPGIDSEGRYVLRNATDYARFAQAVADAKGSKAVNAVMYADISVSQMVGTTSAAPFKGTFDGNGHTLNVRIDGGDEKFVAPFQYAGECTIKDLHVAGSVTGGQHTSGLVGETLAGITVIRSRVSATVNSSNDHVGGFIGHGETYNNTINNCLFDGTLTAVNNSYAGAFVGWEEGGNANKIINCLEHGSYLNVQHANMNWSNNHGSIISYGNSGENKNNWSYQTWDTTKDCHVGSLTADELVQKLGSSWVNVEGVAVPRVSSTPLNTNEQGTSAEGLTPAALTKALGETNWQQAGNQVVPVMSTSTSAEHQTLIWDDRAEVVLTVNKFFHETADERSTTIPDGYMSIASAADWSRFVRAVHEAKGKKDVNAVLVADISVSEWVGMEEEAPYRGTFDGHRHTLTVNLSASLPYAAPFHYVGGTTTIRNLNVKGTIKVKNYPHASGLVGCSLDGGTLVVEGCRVSTTVESESDYAGGIIGHGGKATNTVRDCRFDGDIQCHKYLGIFIGWSEPEGVNTVENCYEEGSFKGGSTVVGANVTYEHGGSGYVADCTNCWAFHYNIKNMSYKGSMTPAQLATALGRNWDVDADGQVVPLLQPIIYTEERVVTADERKAGRLTYEVTTSCLDHDFRLAVRKKNSPLAPTDTVGIKATKSDATAEQRIYRYDQNVVMGSATADTLQNGVSLAWKVASGVADYFRILRYDKMTPVQTDTIEAQYNETAYIDRTVRAQHDYVYTIEGVTQCEGNHVSQVQVEGCCEPTGMVRGYVRLANGIGLPGLTVTATPKDIMGASEASCVTDSTGYYEIGGLIYQKEGAYSLNVGGGNFSAQTVTFDEEVNLVTNVVFYSTQYYNFSGFVLYEGSSIPVSGVQFLRDGVLVVDAKGQPVTTDTQGAFTVAIPQGSHTIQAVKDGHVFQNEGYYIDLDTESSKVNWQKDRSEIYLWDQTRVTLQGRVVGGNDQGTKELGQSLSKNNLGDELTIEFQLEGDNASWIVRDQKDNTVTERHETFHHGRNNKDVTTMDSYRHRIVVHPDTLTGEYQVPFYPVKFKVTEVYANGYPTLFQTGTVSETLDLTDKHQGDTATWSRIYHSLPTLDVWQFTGSQDRYYGVKQYTARDNAGGQDTVMLWRKDVGYTLGYPVFMAGNSVPMVLSAREEYFYNNNRLTAPDIVQLHGGRVVIGNELVGNNQTDEVTLDSVGQGTYTFTPQNLTFLMENDLALRTLKFTLEHDGSFYDIAPIKGYVMAATAKPQGRRIVAGQNVHLVDILRDPPGAGSSAYIAKGSKMNYTYTADLKASLGMSFALEWGTGSNYYTGLWMGAGSGTAAGNIMNSDKTSTLNLNIATEYYTDWSYSYTIETKERISTSATGLAVGMDADVYIGVTDNIIVEDGIAVRAVGSRALNRLQPGMGGSFDVGGKAFKVSGTAKVLARGYDPVKEDSVYLVRDEVLTVGPQVQTTFAHSQNYLLNELIPTLLLTRNALLLDVSVGDDYAQAVANQTGMPAYRSLVATTDEHFATDTAYYRRYVPAGQTDVWNDSILSLNQQAYTWAQFIAANEQEKLSATDLVKNYDFDGRTSVTYSESFATGEGLHRYVKFPSVNGSWASQKLGTKFGDTSKGEADENPLTNKIEFHAAGNYIKLSVTPKLSFDFNYKSGQQTDYSKETGFTLACGVRSNLSVGVYHTRVLGTDSIASLAKLGGLEMFYTSVEDNLKKIYGGEAEVVNAMTYLSSLNSTPRYRSFVFRTLSGATAGPWEEERRTIFYNPGTILDYATQQIDKLRVWTDMPSVANVPYGDPARFKIFLTNESEHPASVTKSLTLYLDDKSNPKGAKVFIGGAPLSGDGMGVWLEGGAIAEKVVEVYAAEDFDYEDLMLCLKDPADPAHVASLKLSAHFVPSAGAVNISAPGDKWVVNTESAYDSNRRLYYLPVHIDGYDINYRNFDHIELQYKLSTQGDKDWVNVCSYYPNTEEGQQRMALASGERKLMDHDGYIDATFYGEKDPIEQRYDLRAVCFCRHGNGYLTRSSDILSGIKDTRRPQPFGTPQPVNGILGIGDDIKIPFSESIAGNYLTSVNNFEVLGMTNSSNVNLSTVLHFDGENSIAITQADRNLSAKDFTIDVMLNPSANGEAMAFASHGSMDHNFVLGVAADRRLLAIVEGQRVESDRVVDFNGLHHVAYAFKADDEAKLTTITFYDGPTRIGQKTINSLYYGTGSALFVGGDAYGYGWDENNAIKQTRPDVKPYTGDMLELRLWNKTLSPSEMSNYGQKRLTGYELGLASYYPMNEGKGDYAYDQGAGGNDLILSGTTWKVPAGISLQLDGKTAVPLQSNFFNREDYQDYTLMMWFRSTEADGTLIANGTATDEPAAKEHLNLGVRDGNIVFRSGGQEAVAEGTYADGEWHHVAVTVNRPRNVGNLYVDQQLRQTFAVDTLGGINGNHLALGATFNSPLGSAASPGEELSTFNSQLSTFNSYLTGNIDEVAMYEMALPENILKSYATMTPTGREAGTMVYLPFSQSERQGDNSQRLMPTGLSLRRYKDNEGNVVETHRDTIVAQAIVDELADRTVYAPMGNMGNLENIKYSFVAKDNELLVHLDVPDYQIEKTNVYVTVKEVADLQGNLMASPVVMDLYVYRNPLRWTVKRLNHSMPYGWGTDFEATIQNLSGTTKRYTIEGLPLWITASQTSGQVAALDEQTITFSVSPYINIGDFDEVIYLVGEDGMSEPLPIELKVRGEEPAWAVADNLRSRNITMTMIARVQVNGAVAHDPDDMLAAFGTGHQLLGVSHMEVDNANNANDGLAYMTIYNSSRAAAPLTFEFYDASTGRIHVVKPSEAAITFQADAILGSTAKPVVLADTDERVQTLALTKGWNWISFNVLPAEATVSELLNNATAWQPGDGIEVIKADGTPYLFTYKAVSDPKDPKTLKYFWDNGDQVIRLDPTLMYRFYSQDDKAAYLAGEVTNEPITLRKGWNRIGFLSDMNLPIATALTDYTDKAAEGDIIKSQSEFAVLTLDAQGNRSWRGTLKYMRTGEGYMLRRTADTETSFWYPSYYSDSRYNRARVAGAEGPHDAPLFRNASGASMTVVAAAADIAVEPGDRLTAYRGTDVCGIAHADADGLFFLSIADPQMANEMVNGQSSNRKSSNRQMTEPLAFTLERSGELLATAASPFAYAANAAIGTPDAPTAITFTSADALDAEGWYTVSGIKMANEMVNGKSSNRKSSNRQMPRGVYIHGNQRVIVK